MEEMIKIQSLRWYPAATAEQMAALMEAMEKNDSTELMLLPDPASPALYRGILLAKYYTPALSNILGVRETRQEGAFQYIMVEGTSIRGVVSTLIRRMRLQCDRNEENTDGGEAFWPLLEREAENRSIMEFLKQKAPAQIERELNERIIGQPELTKAVADFLYYHALRQLHPELPQRPLLISGPSGSGKTEVWREVSRLYGSTFQIKIIDGSSMSCEGWAGSFKIGTFLDASTVNGGILVVDEFDKLTKPKHSASGDNVSLDVQAEFLKLIEGEYLVTEKRKQTSMTSKKMGFVLVGAFESLRERKQAKQAKAAPRIGFCTESAAFRPTAEQGCDQLTDADFISYGIMPEIVGRIAAKCTTAPLTDKAYMDIIRGPHSRVALMEQVLKRYGAQVSDVISKEALREMVAASRSNKTGVRWVSAQVENRLLEAIREKGLFPDEGLEKCG